MNGQEPTPVLPKTQPGNVGGLSLKEILLFGWPLVLFFVTYPLHFLLGLICVVSVSINASLYRYECSTYTKIALHGLIAVATLAIFCGIVLLLCSRVGERFR